MINAGTVCQTTSYCRYSWGIAVSMLLATGTRGRDTDKAWDLNNMPVDRVVIAPEALIPETLVPGEIQPGSFHGNKQWEKGASSQL